jgi:hypothetical protein
MPIAGGEPDFCGVQPSSRIRAQTASICSGLAAVCITISMKNRSVSIDP